MENKKAYEVLGLTEQDVLEIQEWLYPMIMDTDSIGDMISKTVPRFMDQKRYYALYLLGNQMGQASVKEQIGIPHYLNKNDV